MAYDFDWDERNVDHVARHGVDPDEVEEVFAQRPLIRRVRDGRYLALGQSEAGHFLAVIFDGRPKGGLIRVVTARNMTNPERDYYRRSGK